MYLTGSFVKTITVSGDVVTVEWQDADGDDGTDITFTLGGGDWVDLGDTPSTITADEWVRGNTAGDALEFAVPTFTELDETPTTISADDCLMGNAAGDALMFGACTGSGGGGGGDITAVSTAVNSGLAGGANSGAVDLEVDPTNAPRLTALASDDEILVADTSASGALRNAELSVLATLIDAPTDSDIDARIATYARATPSGTIATAQLPSANALDSELPNVSGFPRSDRGGRADRHLCPRVAHGHDCHGSATIGQRAGLGAARRVGLRDGHGRGRRIRRGERSQQPHPDLVFGHYGSGTSVRSRSTS